MAPIVEHQRAPIGVSTFAWVLMLIQRASVEVRERMVVARKVRRHPVDDDSDSFLVQMVDEKTQIIGMPVPRSGSVIPSDLIAPRSAERMFCHRQQLDV